uniref:Battenin n=1 Tax=Angiostrongylus cantonensis TaxID=6313 RepID=A0A0K0DEI7_ANGCA
MNDDIPLPSQHPTWPKSSSRSFEDYLKLRSNKRAIMPPRYSRAGGDDGRAGLSQNRHLSSRNLIGFWVLGLCNNFAYVVMLSAAKDILESDSGSRIHNVTHACREEIVDRHCQKLSTGAVLLADIIPALVVKYTVGVVITSLGSGLGEVSYLALASYFDARVISMWSSGTGGAGIIGAMTYAILTDRLMLHFSSRAALCGMLVVPLVFAYTYVFVVIKNFFADISYFSFWCVLELPNSIHRINVCDRKTYFVSMRRGKPKKYFDHRSKSMIIFALFVQLHHQLSSNRDSHERRLSSSSDSYIERPLLDDDIEDDGHFTTRYQRSFLIRQKVRTVIPLLKYMLPLVIVYFSEYFINQGLLELMEFSCSRGFGLTTASQYRWYQVLYQVGVFVSRSSSECIALPGEALPVLAMLQVLNVTIFYFEAVTGFMSHILLLMCLIIYEGLLGGAAYVNTFKVIHQEVPADRKEFSLGFVSISDTFGILLAGFTAIPVHNIICERPL